jgi:hypothetical protein
VVCGAAQPSIETALARRHLSDGTLALYDVSSSYVEGRCCELARFGHSRDSRPDKMQIVFGLLCAADRCPVSIEVFEGNTGDPSTLGNQIAKLKERFGLKRVVVVGDRGMITQARIEEELKPAGLDWITAPRAPAIQQLAAEGGPLQLSLFDERDLAEIESPDFPGERLIVCKNPALAEERRRKRYELLDATEQDLKDIQARIVRKRRPLRGADKIGLRAAHQCSSPMLSMPPIRCAPTRAWPMSSAPFAASKPSISTFFRSSIGSAHACAPTCWCAHRTAPGSHELQVDAGTICGGLA